MIGKVTPINLAYYVPDSNSFVVTCRLTNGVKNTPSTCDILIELSQVYKINPGAFSLFANNSEQWVLIRSNTSAIQSYADRSRVLDKILEFPQEFNSDSECFSLRWYTHYSKFQKQLQFRILMGIDFQTMTNRKCTLHPFSVVYPSFMHSQLSFKQNYIEIRFAPNEQPIDESFAHELRNNVEWQFVTVEITHIYRSSASSSKNSSTYYIVTDITDGNYRWYVWKTSRTIQTFLNETLKSLSHQFEKFTYSDHFAQIASMLITQRAQTAYSTAQLKEILTASDPLQSQPKGKDGKKKVDGRGKWTADVPVWDPDIIQIKRETTGCPIIADNIRLEIKSFSIKYQPNARGIKRKTPQLPPDGLSSVDNTPKHVASDSLSAELSSAEDEEDDGTGTSRTNVEITSQPQNCNPFPVFLQIRGGPDIFHEGSLHISRTQTDEIFTVPQRLQLERDILERRKILKREKHLSDNTLDLIHSVITQSSLDPAGKGRERALSDAVDKPTQYDRQPKVVYIVLYEGHDYAYITYIIACTMFTVIFILCCIGFACIIIEQMQIRRYSSCSTSSLFLSNSYSGNQRSPKRKNTSTPPKRRLVSTSF